MPRFIKQQDKIIIELYPRSSQQQLLEALLNQKWRSILQRAKLLGVSRDLSYIHSQLRENQQDWTSEEDAIICQYYQLGDKQTLAKLLPHRYWSAQKTRANKLNLIFNKIKKQQNIINQQFNFWKIVKIQGTKVECICTGCNIAIKQLEKYDVINGRTKSCGCQKNNLTQQTNIKNYGVSSYTKTKQHQVDKQQTCIEKYGVANNLDIPGQRAANAKKTKQTKIKNGLIKQLDNNQTLGEYSKQVGANYSHALYIFKTFGEQQALEYLNNYQGKYTYGTAEQPLITLLKDLIPNIAHYGKTPKEFKTNNKPDFRIQHNNKILYINIDRLFWHSDLRKLSNSYHLELREKFQKNNCTLFQFREDEIRDKPLIIKSITLNYLGIQQNKIYARMCKIKQVSAHDARRFFNENHLMGYIAAPTYGLYYDDQLVVAISIKTKKQGIDIARLCSKLNTSITGGLSKLLSHAIKIYNPQFIQSYVDFRYATGHSYVKLNFKLENVSLGFCWTDFQQAFNRLRCRANMDYRGLSEKQYAKELGWAKIYDAGQAKYVKYVKDS